MHTDPAVYAHRGFAGRFPENTVAAAAGSVRLGADAIEIDVMPTADGDVVVFHDRRLDAGPDSRGITDAAGFVWERPTAVVTDARVRGSDATVPLLSSVADAVPPDVELSIELKNPGTAELHPGETFPSPERVPNLDRWRSFAADVVDVSSGVDNPIEYSCFCAGGLRALAELDPGGALAVPFRRDVAVGREFVRRYDPESIHVPLSLLVGTPLFDAETHDVSAFGDASGPVAWGETAGVDVLAWTVRTWWEARAAVEAGCDGFFADYPDLHRAE